MSKRRRTLLIKYCIRRTALNLSNAEVNGIYPRGAVRGTSERINSVPRAVARFERMNATPLTKRMGSEKKQTNRFNESHRTDFVGLLDEAERFEHCGDYGKAEAIYNQLIHFCKNKFGLGRYETAIPYGRLARISFRRGRLEMAERLSEKSLEVLNRTVGAGHNRAVPLRTSLASGDR
jgi:hypothetical protein